MLALLLGTLAFLASARRRHVGAAIVVAVPLGVSLASWRLFLLWQQSLSGQDFGRRSLTDLLHRHDWTIVSRELVRELANVGHWGLLWPVVASGLLVGLLRPATRRRTAILAIATGGPIALFQVAYLFSVWGDLAAHIQSSLPRLLLQLAPLAIVGAAYGVGGPAESECTEAATAMALE